MSIKGLRRRALAVGVVSATALVLGACGGSAESADEPADGLTTIRLVDLTSTKKTTIADEKGYFKKHGLKVEISSLASGVDVLAALQGGSADIGYADLFAGINAVSNGFDVSLVANNNGQPAKQPYIVQADGPIKEPKDLEGRTIGVPPVPQMTVNTRGWMENNGIDSSKVKFTIIRDLGTTAEVLAGGSVDAVYSNYTQAYLNEGKGKSYDFRILGDSSTTGYASPKATTAGYWATTKWAKANPETAEKFAAALHEYNAWILGLPADEKIALQKEYYKLDFAAISGGDEAKLADLLTPNEQSEPLDLAATQEWYDTGLKYAGDKIAKGVDLESIVFPSALK